MLKLFVAAAQLALPLCLLSAALIVNRAYAPTRRQRVGRLTVASLLAGALVAAVIVWLRLTTKHIRLPVINIWAGSLLLAAQFVFLVALWLMHRRQLVSESTDWRHRLLTAASLASLALVNVFYGIPLYLSVDAVVPMGGTLLASDSLVNLIGYLLGIAVAAFAAWAFARSLGRIPDLARQILTTATLALAILCQWAPLYRQYATVKLVPKSSANFAALLWIQRNSVTILLTYTALVVVVALIAWFTRQRHAAPDAVPAERRLVKAETISRRRLLGLSAVVGTGLALTFTLGKKIAETVPELSPIEESVVNGDRVEVDLALVSDGHLHRFAYDANGTEVRFIAIQKNSAVFGTGLDACEICGPSGYYEHDGKVICRKCDVIMNIQTIGFPGGCNPIPLSYELSEGKLLFQVAELEEQAKVFR